ncbi:nucleophile aminohydrolase [Pavlovales sp. CCMP2436]|nr:nucleophile aminohydrolase [Pavlovales sp. CCMP2436]
MSVETEPLIEQLFVAKPAGLASADFEKELYMVRLSEWVLTKQANGEIPAARAAPSVMPTTRVLNAAGYTREHIEMIMRPMLSGKAWERNPEIPEWKKAFYEFHSCTMEPWDGPAMMAFTDGRNMALPSSLLAAGLLRFVGANLDRNGLRPCRYYVTKDDHVILASEVGVVAHLKEEDVVKKGRLEPGRMFLIDFEKGEILDDNAIKMESAKAQPYQLWLNKGLVRAHALLPLPPPKRILVINKY